MLSQTERAKRKAQSERDKKIQQRQAQSVRDKKEYQRKAQVENHKKEQTRKAQSKRDKELHRQHEQSTRGQDQSQQLKQQNSASSILPQPKSIHQNQFGLKVLSEPDREESNVDVVAVHGIGANPDYTWTTSSVNWLQHCSMLPQALPKARIMRFGYASQWFGEETIRQSLSSIANSFLSALCEERE
ncbi:hypothetical protein MMC14_008279, partial [Varicellaria rhodocarpa]|nr:hypothetical protein [Varicellaria rhodocarpa]